MNQRFAIVSVGRKAITSTRARCAAVAVALVVPALAMAQSAGDPFDTAMTTATDKVSSYAAALVGLAAVAVVFMIGVKYVKKITKAA